MTKLPQTRHSLGLQPIHTTTAHRPLTSARNWSPQALKSYTQLFLENSRFVLHRWGPQNVRPHTERVACGSGVGWARPPESTQPTARSTPPKVSPVTAERSQRQEEPKASELDPQSQLPLNRITRDQGARTPGTDTDTCHTPVSQEAAPGLRWWPL